jgi:hypothetical protein
MVIIYSFYFFWQQYHYSKQNYGIARRQSNSKEFPGWIDQSFFLGTTLIAMLCLFHGGSETFFGYQLKNFFGVSLSTQIGIPLNLILLFFYLRIRKANFILACSHVFIFSLAYGGLIEFTEGWLYLNVFHNAQYLLFMKANEKKISYLLFSIGLTIILWLLSTFSLSGIMLNSFSLILFIMLSLNFTHYIFDGIVWKIKRI